MKFFCILFLLVTAKALGQQVIPVTRLGKSTSAWINKKQLLIIGEIHGTNEVPEAFYAMAKQFIRSGKNIKIGLEISESGQSSIDSFLRSDDEQILKRMDFFTSAFKDGRSSKAMEGLIKNIRKLHVPLFCFETRLGSSQQRDSAMAINIEKQLRSDTLTIVLVGNLHAKKIPVSFNGSQPAYRPMASFLSNRLGDKILSLNTAFAAGQAWNCRDEGCKVYGLPPKPDLIRKYGKKTTLIICNSSVEYDGLIYFRKGSASLPLFNP